MEKLDLYDINGNKLGKTIVRGQKPDKNEYIKLTVIYIKSGDRFLFQKCSSQKDGKFAVTGGHVSSGNSSETQACIEIKEELGLNIDIRKLKFLGNIYKSSAIFDIYLYEDKNLKEFNFQLQTEEVESVHWLTKSEIEELIEKGLVRESSCQHYNKFIKDFEIFKE